ncbi:uncharacterized protein LOC129586543 [Paramacrobiotus metropolitanus]|uniref:uncharacterized protein LOC129586543 n=1 Tax=Paramacrobiotus metropolitanus TaxID=2943436 RepID=UPI0024458541|nr:uncharacterized protein LOC129586543 [Paramacrobiotus metropolitanus]
MNKMLFGSTAELAWSSLKIWDCHRRQRFLHGSACMLVSVLSNKSRKKMDEKHRVLMAKLERKILQRDAARKPHTHTVGYLSKGKTDSTPWSAAYLREHEPRHVKMVESVLLDRITELLADARFSELLMEISIEITGVQINRNRGQLNILWAPTGDPLADKKIHQILQSMTPDLREHLCSQHILGFVPRIEFVRDKTIRCLKELQDRMALLDTGPPDEPLDTVDREVLEVTVQGGPSSGLETTLSGPMMDPLGLDRVPPMRTDIGGIDRTKLLEQMQQGFYRAGPRINRKDKAENLSDDRAETAAS